MAPPRQRTTGTATATAPGAGTGATADDSRSEASSGPGPGHGSGQGPREKSSKTATTSTARKAIPGFRAENRIAAGSGYPSVTSAPQEVPNIPWSDMPLDILHAYRHAYNLPVASAYSGPYSRILLSQGIGLRSPTSIAVQRAQSQSQSQGQSHRQRQRNGNGDGGVGKHRIIGQNRVGKEQLALAVRRHFNSAGLAEQETIARFLYKVREEGKGRQFRLRFQP